MDSQKMAGSLATAIAVVVLAAVFYYGSKQSTKAIPKAEPTAVSPDKAPASPKATRGPVVRDLPLDQ